LPSTKLFRHEFDSSTFAMDTLGKRKKHIRFGKKFDWVEEDSIRFKINLIGWRGLTPSTQSNLLVKPLHPIKFISESDMLFPIER